MRAIWWCSALVLAGCEGPPQSYAGDDIYKYFQYETLRTWTFENDDTSIPYHLIAQQEVDLDSDVADDQVQVITWTADCFNGAAPCDVDDPPGGLVNFEESTVDTWRYSTDPVAGVRLYELGGVVFDPPILLAKSKMKVNESATSESGGITFTTTYGDEEQCPGDYLGTDEVQCVRLDLTADSASPVTGSYWVVNAFSIVAFKRADDGEFPWTLRKIKTEEL